MLNSIKLTGSISSVVIDSTDLIDVPSKLQTTKRFACFFEDSDAFFRHSKFAGGRYLRMPNGRTCLLDFVLSDYSLLTKFDLFAAFLVTEELPMYFILSIFSRMVQKKIIFVAEQLFDHEMVQANFIAKSLEPNLKQQLVVK